MNIVSSLRAGLAAIGTILIAVEPSGAQSPDYARIVMLREQQELYSAEPVTVILNGRTIGTLGNGTFLSADVLAGTQSLTASIRLSQAFTTFDLRAGKTAYIVLKMESGNLMSAGGLGPGAQLALVPQGTSGQNLLSMHFVDESSAKTALAALPLAQ